MVCLAAPKFFLLAWLIRFHSISNKKQSTMTAQQLLTSSVRLLRRSSSIRMSLKDPFFIPDLSELAPAGIKSVVEKSTASAVEIGSLVTFPSDLHIVHDDMMDVDFAVRVSNNLSRKPTLTSPSDGANKEKDPFVPPFENGLCVGNLDSHHRLLLNKFNVVSQHVLITTIEMEHQFSPIRSNAFPAISRVLESLDGLVFFNRGKFSGASQPHKHYQVIPRKISEEVTDLPITKAILEFVAKEKLEDGTVFSISNFPFKHACVHSTQNFTSSQLEENYHKLLNAVGFTENIDDTDLSYNWMSTQNWMMIVPRTKENYEESVNLLTSDLKMQDFSASFELLRKTTKIPINSLGFAGTLFVKSDTALRHIIAKQPREIISQVAVERHRSKQ